MRQTALLPKLVGIEVARSVLSAFSYSDCASPQAIHFKRIQSQFERAGMATGLTAVLRGLVWLREAEKLQHGYWMAGPTRRVPMSDEMSLLISVSPTRELSRHFKGIAHAGLARVIAQSDATRLPVQQIDSWLGIDDINAERWAENQLAVDDTMFSAVTPEPSMQVFSVSSRHNRPRSLRTPLWLPWDDRRAATVKGVQLYRDRVGRNYRLFLGKRRHTSTFLEGPYPTDARRLQYGLAALTGVPLEVAVIERRDAIHIQFPLDAPPFLYRLLIALCTRGPSGIWTCRTRGGWPTLLQYLNSLGCEVVTDE